MISLFTCVEVATNILRQGGVSSRETDGCVTAGGGLVQKRTESEYDLCPKDEKNENICLYKQSRKNGTGMRDEAVAKCMQSNNITREISTTSPSKRLFWEELEVSLP